MASYEDEDPHPRGWSPLAVALIATLVLLLGLGGALFGIYVADKNAQAGSGPSATPPTVTTPATTTPPATPSPTPTVGPSSPAVDAFALPDLSGVDFQTARTKIRELKLGWRLIFEGTDNDASVRTTDPAPGAMVAKGTTVKIYVKGAAPLATVPGVEGLACNEAAALIVDHGLYPTYLTGKTGTVQLQSPDATDPQTLHWNDQVQLTCG
ncbi:MAG TPA: PASTA domain-containing protein [Micromonosporaceae bacterium]